MCRNIKPLFNFEPPATKEEIKDASIQFVRKISGFQKPSQVNEVAFNQAVDEVSVVIQELLNSLETDSAPKNREEEAERRRILSEKRFGTSFNKNSL